jgi:dienelactone hydrolase
MIPDVDRKPPLLRRVRKALANAWRAVTPGRRAWRGAAWGGLVALLLILIVTAIGLFGHTTPKWFAMGVVPFIVAFLLAGGLLTLIWRILKALPTLYAWVLLSGLLVLANLMLVALSVSLGTLVVGFGTLALASLVGAGSAVLIRGGWSRLTRIKRVITAGGMTLGLVGLIVGGAWLLDAGSPLPQPPNAAAQAAARVTPLDLPDPSQPGPYAVQTLFYGSGEDLRRAEYSTEVDLLTGPVDGSALVDRWSRLRTAYWGFGPEALPLNGRVWYPAPVRSEAEGGAGPFPLVLIVHGQHPMEDFSDPGYAYLGELLASRGFIVVSVDENFLNLSPLADLIAFQSLVEVDDLRGWLLLEHLSVWQDWNEDPESPFYQRVDMDQIALIGHSRGGQAVAVAAAFNELPYYPDDGSVRFNYGFNLRSVVAFAPVDGGYLPAEQPIVLENVNYLVLHGSHDMDVFTFQGDRQYSRVHFTDGRDGFKAAVYIYGANHGQFNTSWGRKDLFEPVMRMFNLEQLMPGEEQRQVAEVTISAFLDGTLRGETGYRALFQDLRRGRAWLPETIYLHQYQDSATRMVCTYEEDVDLASCTLPGGRAEGQNLTIWREQPARSKWQDLGDQTVYLGWDASAMPAAASYTIELPLQSQTLTEESTLVFALADADEDPTPDTQAEEAETPREPIDLTVEVVDAAGESARLPLGHVSLLQPQLEGRLGKAGFMSPFPTSEAVLQHFEFPLEDFVAMNPAFDPQDLERVSFIFDRTGAGVVVLDNVGFRE